MGFCGSSGSGKSTIAHVLALRGPSLWADDVLAFQADSKKAIATALPFRPKLRPASAAFLRRRASLKPSEGDAPEIATPWSTETLTALFVLSPTGRARTSSGRLELTRLSASKAIAALLPHGFRCKPLEREREQGILTAYVGLVESVRVYSVEYERGFARFSALVNRLEAVIRAGATSSD